MPRRLVGWFAGRARLALVPALVVALVFSFVARQDLDTVLKAKHPSGAQSYGADDVVALFDVEESREKARDAVVGWVRYGKLVESNLSRPSASARRVLGAYLLVDALVFAVAFALAIGLVFLRASPSAVADAWGGVQVNDWRRHVQRLPLLLVGLALVLDWLENLTLWRIVDGGWGSGNVDGDLVGVLHWLTVAKWLAVVFVAVPAVFLAYNALRDRIRFSDVWRVVRRLRIHVLLPIMFAAILLGHEQMPDLIRRWSVVELGWSVLAALSLALALWLGASKLLVIGRPRAITRFTHPLASYGLVGCFLLVALGLFLVDHQTQHDVGWGLLIPAALVAGLALVSAVLTLLRPPEPRGAPPQRAQQVAWPVETEDGELEPPARGVERVLAAIVLGALGLAVFHASFAFAVDAREWSWATLLVGGVVCVGATVGVVAHARLDRWYTEPFLVALAFGTSVYLALRLEAAFDADPARDELDLSLLSLTGVLLGLAAIALFTMLGRYAGERARTFWVGLIMVTFFTVEIAIAVVVDPWSVAGRLGGVAVLGAFFALLAVVGFVAVWYADAVPAPPALRALRVRGFPVLTLGVVWLALASVFDAGGYHDVRTRAGPVTSIRLVDAWSCWLARNGLSRRAPAGCPAEPAAVQRAGASPLVFVSSSGGGMRAAFWTALVLDCAFEVAPSPTANYPCPSLERTDDFLRSDAIFAASGISGGSLGIAAYSAYLTEKGAGIGPGWPNERLDADSLSASVAWWLFVEGPRALLRFDNATDRAEVLERGWELDWARGAVDAEGGLAQGLLRLSRENPHVPLLLLNGTSVADGCRFNVSVLRARIASFRPQPREFERCRSTDPFEERSLDAATRLSEPNAVPRSALAGTRDVVDFLCGADIPLSTAALLSARFPFVSPSGRIAHCTEKSVSFVVDGGYLDTSGASPVVELSTGLLGRIQAYNRAQRGERCVVPFLIQIDNGVDPGSNGLSDRPAEVSVPLKTVFQTRLGRAANARTDAALLFTSGFDGATYADGPRPMPLRDRFAHFVNLPQSGPQAPLGWTLSEDSRQDLRDQLGQEQNLAALSEVREWFDGAAAGRLSCRALPR